MPPPPPLRTPNLELTLAELRPVELLSAGAAANVYRAAEAREGGGVETVVAKLCAPSESAGRERECAVLESHPLSEMPRLLGADLSPAAVILMSLCAGAPVSTLVRAPGDVPRAAGSGPDERTTNAPQDVGGQREAALRAVSEKLEPLLGRLHAAGFAHGGIDGSTVLVDAAGTVSLVGFRRVVFADEAAFGESCSADLRAARSLADSLTASSATSAGPALMDSAADAPPTPPRAVIASGGVGAVVSVAGGSGSGWDWNPAEPVRAAVEEPRLAEVLDPALAAVGEVWPVVRSAVRRKSRRMLSGRRGRAIALVVAAAAVLAVGVSWVLDRRAADDPVPRGSPTVGVGAPVASAVAGGDANRTPAASQKEERGWSGAAAVSRAADERVEAARATRAEDGAILADDPVAGLQALLGRRSRALASGELEALQEVSGWGSPAAEADSLLLEARTRPASDGDSGGGGNRDGAGAGAGGGGSAPPAVDPLAGAGEFALVQRLGDLAVVSARSRDGEHLMSVLVMKGGGGWRIRSYDGEPPGG